MSLTRISRDDHWTWEAYLEWEARQPLRYALVDGDVYAMTGGTSFHDTISLNIGAELRDRLRGSPCRAHGSNLKVRAGTSGRYPDALVDCGLRAGDALVASEPAAVFEVLSRSTAWLDTGLKLRDYDATESIRTCALIDQASHGFSSTAGTQADACPASASSCSRASRRRSSCRTPASPSRSKQSTRASTSRSSRGREAIPQAGSTAGK